MTKTEVKVGATRSQDEYALSKTVNKIVQSSETRKQGQVEQIVTQFDSPIKCVSYKEEQSEREGETYLRMSPPKQFEGFEPVTRELPTPPFHWHLRNTKSDC